MGRKHLADGTVTTSATETTMYTPSGALVGTIGSATFFNSSASARVLVTVYGPHAGAGTNGDIVDEFYLEPRRSRVCTRLINKVCEGSQSHLVSVECDTGSDVLSYNLDGFEE
jgi:hypothetical protein